MGNDITFTQNIKFVDYSTLNNLLRQNKVKKIGFQLTDPLYVKGDLFGTEGIKTCSGGILTDGKSNAVGIHWLDDIENYLQINKFCDYTYKAAEKPTTGLLVGSKYLDARKYSVCMFRQIVKYFSEKIKNLTVFEEHISPNGFGYTSFLYDLKTNTTTLYTEFCGSSVENLKDLKHCFRKITIADNDRLFIGDKEISKEEIKAVLL